MRAILSLVMIVLFFLLSLLSPLSQSSESNVASKGSETSVRFRVIDAYPLGEKLTYSISYFALPAGEATLEVKEIMTLQDEKVYHLVAAARSSALFSLFYSVNDRVESFVRVGDLLPVRFEKHLREGKDYVNDEITLFDQVGNRVENNGKFMDVPAGIQDALSAVYYLRLQSLEVGETLFIDVNADEKNYRVKIDVVREEKITRSGQEINTLVVRPFLQSVKLGGILKEKGEIFIWLTDDTKRVPIKITARVLIGHLSFRLKLPGEKQGRKGRKIRRRSGRRI